MTAVDQAAALCSHCRYNPRPPSRKLCIACRQYERRNGALPSDEIISRRMGAVAETIWARPYGSAQDIADMIDRGFTTWDSYGA